MKISPIFHHDTHVQPFYSALVSSLITDEHYPVWGITTQERREPTEAIKSVTNRTL